jgi:hypothetical protein
MTPQEKAFDEAVRENGWNCVQHLEEIQAMIAFLDSQQSVPRNSKAGALAKQAKLLQGMKPKPSDVSSNETSK